VLLALFLGIGLLAACSRTGLLPNPVDETREEEPPELTCPGLAVTGVQTGEIRQMDLLFVIDNSGSMADKQELLAEAVPVLVRRLANPACVRIDAPDVEINVATSTEPCPAGYRREFEALTDLHVGVITSSLGTVGGDLCPDSGPSFPVNDHAHLLASLSRASNLPTYQQLGFLSWDPEQQQVPPGESDLSRLQRVFTDMVKLAGEDGCGLEAPLEAWYRFLIDPAPYASVRTDRGFADPSGVDNLVLRQRAQFLRPDSVVTVVMLSDENDCSLMARGSGFVAGSSLFRGMPFTMPPATSACATDPNSPCCRSCGTSEPKTPAGCTPLNRDPACQTSLSPTTDPIELRCFNHKRRFGVDLLYPTARYAVGLKSQTLCPSSIYNDADCTCQAARERAAELGLPSPPCTAKETGAAVPNPLYQNLNGDPNAIERDPSQVFLTGIVGVPWQDLATPETLKDPNRLEYLNAAQLNQNVPGLTVDRWAVMLGNLTTNTPPLDPFMRESTTPRSGTNPITSDPIVPATSKDPNANAINGHERQTGGSSLQYACTFPLRKPHTCTTMNDCVCLDDERSSSNPACQALPGQTQLKNTQFSAVAYPGLRELDVLRRHGGNAIVASICPKASLKGSQDFQVGYGPAVAGLLRRLHCASLSGNFETDETSDDYGTVACRLIGVRRNTGGGSCSCDGETRFELSPDDALAVRMELSARGLCGTTKNATCSEFCACEVPQLRGAGLEACQNDTSKLPLDPVSAQPVNGWCYIDPARGFGALELVESCPAGSLHNVRLLGSAAPQEGERLLSVCGDVCQVP